MNVPWVVFGSGLFIGVLMLGYTRLVSVLAAPVGASDHPGRHGGRDARRSGRSSRPAGDWVSVAFYVWGALLGILLISQFWTLANGIYDPRQAKRLFGFIGGGVMLGGMTGARLTATIVETVGANTLLLWSAFTLAGLHGHRVGHPRRGSTGCAVGRSGRRGRAWRQPRARDSRCSGNRSRFS